MEWAHRGADKEVWQQQDAREDLAPREGCQSKTVGHVEKNWDTTQLIKAETQKLSVSS